VTSHTGALAALAATAELVVILATAAPGTRVRSGSWRRTWMTGAGLTACVAVSLNPARVLAQESAATTSGYVTEAPNNPLWLALATPDGRWAIQLPETCATIAPGMNVTVVGRPDAPDAQLVSTAGESCGVTASVPMGNVPCARDDLGRCEVRRDP
jgi:hypothetical protein